MHIVPVHDAQENYIHFKSLLIKELKCNIVTLMKEKGEK